MGNYEQLKQAVANVIKSNGNQEITGKILQSALLSIISTIGVNATFAGIATPTTVPGTPDQNIFYIASENGIYSNFNSEELNNEVVIFTNENGQWVKKQTDIVQYLKLSESVININNKLLIKNIKLNGGYDLITGIFFKSESYRSTPKIPYILGKSYTFFKGNNSFVPQSVIIYNNDRSFSKYSNLSSVILEDGQSFIINIETSKFSDDIYIRCNDITDEIISTTNNTVFDLDNINFNNKGYIQPSGNIGTGSQGYTDFIELTAPERLELYDVKLIGQSALIAVVSYYTDSTKESIISDYTIAQPLYEGIIDTSKAKKAGAKYVRFCSADKTNAKCLRKISKTTNIEIVDNLTEGGIDKALSAEQGKLIGERLSNFINTYLYTDWLVGYVKPDGSQNTADRNWVRSDFISISDIIRISIDLKGQANAVGVVSYYKEKNSETVINGLTLSQDLYYKIIIGKEEIESVKALGASYVRFSSSSKYDNKVEIEEIAISDGESNKVERDILTPPKIYTVLNDIDEELFKGNYSAGIYLDHFFRGIKEEYDIYFKSSKSDRIVFTSPNKFTGTSTNQLNKGQNVLKENYTEIITGNDVKDKEFTVQHISILNSVTKSKKAHFLCIGNSVTFGQYANIYGTIMQNMYRYSAICEELSVKDRILNGTYNSNDTDTDYVIRSVGNGSFVKQGRYENVDYSFVNSVSGISGATSAEISENFIDENGKFSITKYLSKFRTCDDLGVYLSGTAGQQVQGSDGKQYTIGSEITSINSTTFRCYRPTHIIIASGLNDAGSTEEQIQSWYNATKRMVDEFKEDYVTQGISEPFISIMLPDTGGTIFPSKHPNVSKTCVEWDEYSDSRRDKMNGFVKKWLEENPSETEDERKCWLLPAFWCFPCGESVSYRPANLPDYEVDSQKEISRFQYGSAWGQQTHVNAIGHYNYGYQLYSWIKYTLTL